MGRTGRRLTRWIAVRRCLAMRPDTAARCRRTSGLKMACFLARLLRMPKGPIPAHINLHSTGKMLLARNWKPGAGKNQVSASLFKAGKATHVWPGLLISSPRLATAESADKCGVPAIESRKAGRRQDSPARSASGSSPSCLECRSSQRCVNNDAPVPLCGTTQLSPARSGVPGSPLFGELGGGVLGTLYFKFEPLQGRHTTPALPHCRIRGLKAEYSKSVRRFTST
jgi:hypothetical protein